MEAQTGLVHKRTIGDTDPLLMQLFVSDTPVARDANVVMHVKLTSSVVTITGVPESETDNGKFSFPTTALADVTQATIPFDVEVLGTPKYVVGAGNILQRSRIA